MAVFLVVQANYASSHTTIRLYDEVPPFAIGRSPDVPLHLNAASVSRRHAEMRVHNGKLGIRDIGSTNGLRLPSDRPLLPFVWVEMHSDPIDLTGYFLSAETRPPIVSSAYHTLTDPAEVLNYLPGPYVQSRLLEVEGLLTRPNSHFYATVLPGLVPARDAVFGSLPENLRESVHGAAALLPINGRVRLLLTEHQELTQRYRERLLDLFRDLLGDFLVSEPVCPSVCAWREGLISIMARTIEQDRAFEDLPILADALEEAGCDNLEVLGHLRASVAHFPGCWALRWLTARPSLVPVIQSA